MPWHDMSVAQKAWWLFGGVTALLALATVAGSVLKARASTDAGRAVVANLVARVNAWWVMVAFLAVAFALGRTAMLVMFGFASFFALREFVTLTPTRRGDYVPLLLAFYVLLPLQYALIGLNQYGTYAICIPVYAF